MHFCNRFRGAALAAALALVAAGSAAAQSGPTAPEETDIVVPDLVLEVEELTLEEVSAVLPDAGELALGQVSIPLPGADELEVDDLAFDVAAPIGATEMQETSTFSSGRLGAGSVNHVVGELSLFRLGTDPRFRLRFAHEGLDGYQFNPAGTGYFQTTNVIDGWFAGESPQLATDVEASFSEHVNGLQGRSDFFSVGLRRTGVIANARFTPDPLITLSGLLDASIATRIQSASGGDPVPRNQEFALLPTIGGRVSIGVVELALETSYFLRFLGGGEIPLHQDVELLAGLDVALPAGVDLIGRAGVNWDPDAALVYPWTVSVRALFRDALELTLRGGYRVERLLLTEIWDDVPLAAAGDADGAPDLRNDGQWYGTLDGRWSGAGGLTVTGGVEFIAHEAKVDIGTYDAADDSFPFIQREMLALRTDARASWRPGQRVQVGAGWSGQLLETTSGTPTSTVDASVRVTDAGERLSAVAELRTDFFPEAEMPWLGISGSFALSDEIEFTLELADLLSPLLDEGRASFGGTVNTDYPFIEPGFRASLFTRISL